MSTRRADHVVDIEVSLHHETEKAWLVSTTGDRADAKWVPKAAGELFDGLLTVSEQTAIDKELV